MKTLELDVTFTRDYFTKKAGLRFDESYFEDMEIRCKTDQAAKKCLYYWFADLGLGDSNPAPSVRLGYDDTLNLSLMYGGELSVNGGVAWVHPGFLSWDKVDSVECPDIPHTWPQTLFLEQYEKAVKKYGRSAVKPPRPHGIFEIALDMFGEKLLEAFLLEPERVEHALDAITETVIRFKEFWDIRFFGKPQKNLSLGGCSTTTISSDAFNRFLLPRYQRIAGHFGDAFICACGIVTQHLESFSPILCFLSWLL